MRGSLVVAAAVVALSGCGASPGGRAPVDMARSSVPGGPDMAIPARCNPVDHIVDPACGDGCPAGTIGTVLASTCKCYPVCTVDVQCPCDRTCDILRGKDGSVVGHACLPGNSAVTRCGQDPVTNAYFGSGFCAQGFSCIAAGDAMGPRYCMPVCQGAADCPAQTSCLPTFDTSGAQIGNVCAYDLAGAQTAGQACDATSTCAAGLRCDGVCRPQCDGPGGVCASGSCGALVDAAHGGALIGYVCR